MSKGQDVDYWRTQAHYWRMMYEHQLIPSNDKEARALQKFDRTLELSSVQQRKLTAATDNWMSRIDSIWDDIQQYIFKSKG